MYVFYSHNNNYRMYPISIAKHVLSASTLGSAHPDSFNLKPASQVPATQVRPTAPGARGLAHMGSGGGVVESQGTRTTASRPAVVSRSGVCALDPAGPGTSGQHRVCRGWGRTRTPGAGSGEGGMWPRTSPAGPGGGWGRAGSGAEAHPVFPQDPGKPRDLTAACRPDAGEGSGSPGGRCAGKRRLRAGPAPTERGRAPWALGLAPHAGRARRPAASGEHGPRLHLGRGAGGREPHAGRRGSPGRREGRARKCP